CWKCVMLQEAVDDYIITLSTKELEQGLNNRNTIMAYRNDLSQLCSYLISQGLEDWPQVTREHITAYLLQMRERYAYRPTTIARKLAALKSFFRYVHGAEIITLDPVENMESPRIQKDLPHALDSEQISSLFRQVEESTPSGRRDLAMLHVLHATGMRASELVALNLSDFDAARAVIFCVGHGGQTKRERVLPLSPVA